LNIIHNIVNLRDTDLKQKLSYV